MKWNSYINNNNIPQNDYSQNNPFNLNMDDSKIFGKALNETIPISEKWKSRTK